MDKMTSMADLKSLFQIYKFHNVFDYWLNNTLIGRVPDNGECIGLLTDRAPVHLG